MKEAVPNPGSFEQVVLPHLDAAYSLAVWLMGDKASADDVVQDAMLRALNHLAGFRGENARAWVLQIVRNTASTSLSRRSARRLVPLGDGARDDDAFEAGGAGMDIADTAPDPETSVADAETQSALTCAMAALPVELRECVVLRELEDMSYKEISRIVGAPVGTVMSRLFRARLALSRAVAGGKA